jgi:hypothetical protein
LEKDVRIKKTLADLYEKKMSRMQRTGSKRIYRLDEKEKFLL